MNNNSKNTIENYRVVWLMIMTGTGPFCYSKWLYCCLRGCKCWYHDKIFENISFEKLCCNNFWLEEKSSTLLKLLIFQPDKRIWRLKSISDTSKNFKSILLNKSCVIKEILKYYTDGRLSFPHSLYLPRVVFKRGLCWMVYRYCQFTFQNLCRL